MRFSASAAILLVILFTGAASGLRTIHAAQQTGSLIRPAGGSDAATTVKTYCAGCHNGVMRSPSNAVLDRFDGTAIGDDAEAWSRAYRQLQAGAMPPAGAPRPDRAAAGRLLAAIEAGLGMTALGVTSPGATTVAATEATSQQIAARLASMLWNAAPDAALREEVRRDRLTQPAVLEQQVKRMLADDRTEAFVSRFFLPWLGLDQLGKATPSARNFPDFDVTLRDAMATETRLFIRSQLREDADPVALWNATYSFLNEPLARHYGIAGVAGPEFRRVALNRPERHGLLGQGSILMITSRHDDGPAYTSPAVRSIWIRNHFLGAPAPRPFPSAQPVKPELPITPQTRTLPAQPCLQCHQNFFPLAYTLENFDAVGRWRTEDQQGPVDASGVHVDGTTMRGPDGLRATLLQYPDAFRTTLAERLVLYAAGAPATGAPVTTATLIRAREALHAAGTPRWSSIIAAIARRRG